MSELAETPVRSILTLRANVMRAEAEEIFASRGLLGWARRLHTGPLRRIADVYLPFRMYRVELRDVQKCQWQILAVDAVRGTLDPYRFDQVPEEAELTQVTTRNSPPVALEEARTREVAVESMRRLVYRTGFFRLRDLSITAELIPLDFHVPYWVGFFGRGPQVRIAVLDAVRRRIEGAKARGLFESWLAG